MKHSILVWILALILPVFMTAQSSNEAAHKVAASTNQVFLTNFASTHALQMAHQLEVIDKSHITTRITDDSTGAQWVSITASGHPLIISAANLNAAKTVSTNKIWSGGSLGLNLTGSEITLGLWDGGKVRATHQEFGGRVTQRDGASSLNNHATHVAGTMIAAGVDADAKGMSGEANLDAYDWLLDVAEMSMAAADGLLISNHSYRYYAGWQGSRWYGDTTINRYEDNGFGLYHSSARNLDLIANHAPYYLMCFAASNDRLLQPSGGKGYVWSNSGWVWSNTVRPANGPYDCIPYFNTAKNILTLGNVYDIPGGYTNPGQVVLWSASSCGPTDDGRIKPDLVANGIELKSTSSAGDTLYATMSGTSMSTPNTSGSLGLLQQHALNLYAEYLKASTLKALVIHTADEAGAADGPDYQFGWGLLNSASAAQLMTNRGTSATIDELTLEQGQTYTIQMVSNGTQPLKATIVWNDPAGEEAAWSLNPTDLRLTNDLDLRITKTESTWEPYILDPEFPAAMATTGDNFRDNVEQIYIAAPEAGMYTITVSHKSILQTGKQDFSIIVSGTNQQAPGNFTATTQSENQIDLSWTIRNNRPVLLAWSTNNEFGQPQAGTRYSPGDTLPEGGIVIDTGNSTAYNHLSLAPSTLYCYRLWSLIDETPAYSTATPANATTWCSTVALPVSETVENHQIPPCWEARTQGGSQGFYYSNTNWSGGQKNGELVHAYEYLNGLNNYTIAPNITSRLIIPPINTIGINELTLQFRFTFRDSETWAGLAPVYARIQTSNDGENWTNATWSYASRNGSVYYQLVNVSITNHLNADSTYIAFTIQGDPSDFWYWAIDDVYLSEPASAPRIVMLNLLPEALWNGTQLSPVSEHGENRFAPLIADQVSIELHDQADYAHLIYSADSINLLVSGATQFSVPATFNNTYFITIRHRNSIETVSATPVNLSPAAVSYNFTTSAGQAYGNNLKPLTEGVYGLFSGDVNGDGLIDQADMDTILWGASHFDEGYLPGDLNGDGLIDALDLIIGDNNAANSVSKRVPE